MHLEEVERLGPVDEDKSYRLRLLQKSFTISL